MADSLLERLLVGSAMLAMISDIAGASGGGYSFALPLFGVLALWAANPRGLLVYLGLNGISVLFDIIFMSVQAAGGVGGARPDAAIAFTAINLVVKVVILYFLHFEFVKLGGAYSRTCPTVSSTMSSGGVVSLPAESPAAGGAYENFNAEPPSVSAGAYNAAPDAGGYNAASAPPIVKSSGGYQ